MINLYAPPDERQFWVETVDGLGNRTGIIPNIKSASIRRVMDGVGSITIEVSGTDMNAASLLVDDAKIRLYIFEREEKRLLGSGIIRKRRASDRSSGFSLVCSGPDEIDDLRRKSVLQGLEFNEETIEDIINGTMSITGLLDYLNGWSATVNLGIGVVDSYYARFDGMTVFKALQKLCEEKGIHFRLGDTAQTLEVGNFSTNDVSLIQAAAYTPEMDENDNIGLIESITIDEDGEDKLDFIIALTATTGSDMAVTLEHSTRTTPYSILTDTWNGRTYYYIGSSIKTIDEIMADNSLTIKTLVFDQIQVQSNSDADIESAANALYDAAVAYLTRHLTPYKQYSIQASKIRQNIKPGDRILVQYAGWIEDEEGNLLPPVNINTDLYVIDVTESVSQDGLSTSLKLANVDRHKLSAARVIVGELESAKIRNLTVKPYTTATSFVYARELDPTHTALVPIRITDRVLRVRQVTLNVKTTPFRSTAVGGAAGGDHRHKMFENGIGGAVPAANVNYRAWQSPSGTGAITIGLYANPVVASVYTAESSGNHTHPQEYGIYDDTQYPGDITVSINGVNRTIALGGDWGTSGASTEFTIDITEYILDEATLRQTHEVVFGCGSGRGRIEVSVEIYQDVQNVRVQ
jgi:hypothetical protein